MREIKFRAWDKVNEKIVYDGKKLSNIWTDYDVLINLKGEIFLGADHTNDCCRLHVDGDDPTENYLLMQYTGLKDKNGAEIYEGDLISYSISQTQHYEGFIVWYDTGFSCNVFYHKHDKWAFGDGYERTYIEPQLMNFSSDCIDIKIIGNIYENPELLK